MARSDFYSVIRDDKKADRLISYFRLAAAVEFADANTGRYFDKLRRLYTDWTAGRSLDVNQVKYIRVLVNRLYSVNI